MTVVFAILYLPVDPWVRAFLGIGMLYLTTSTFTLAKVVRDAQEFSSVATRLDHRIEIGILHSYLCEDVSDRRYEQLIMSAGIFQYALGGLPSGGIYYPGDQGGSCRVDREDAH